MQGSLQWFGIGRSETGHVRLSNQDAFAVVNDCSVWIVADGMGGHPAGDVAACTAVEVIAREASRYFGKAAQPGHAADRVLSDLLVEANAEVLARGAEQPSFRGMGTTVVAMTIAATPAPVAHIAHLGDSRAYLYRTDKLTQLTRDHTVVEEYLQKGSINLHEATVHPERHVLTRALGLEEGPLPDLTSIALQPHDHLLLCSDGLTKMLTDENIGFLLAANKGNPDRACNALIEEALSRGGEDNVTVIVCAEAPLHTLKDRTIDKNSSPM